MDQEHGTETARPAPEFKLRLRDDRTAVLLDCTFDGADLEVILERVSEELAKLGIDDFIGQSAAEHHIRAAAARTGHLVNEPILQATPPTPPRPEELVWSREFFKPGFYVDPETDEMDYRRRAAQPAVAAGERLGCIEPGEPGEPGTDLFGEPVPPRPIPEVKVRAGRNVRYDERERAFYAEASGQVCLDGNTLVVDDVFKVPGSVGLETGNIKHPGAMRIEGNIESGSVVEAEGDIEVMGYIEDAEVATAGQLIVHGGITGERARVQAQGAVSAKYIMNATVRAKGDVNVTREIDNGQVYSLGRVCVKGGRIVGGEVMALGGIETGQAGSAAVLPTLLVAGEDFTLQARIARIQADLQQLEGALRQAEEKRQRFSGQEERLTPAGRAALAAVDEQIAEIRAKRLALEEEIDGMRRESLDHACPEVKISGMLYPETRIQIAGLEYRNSNTVRGPLRVLPREEEIALVAPTHG